MDKDIINSEFQFSDREKLVNTDSLACDIDLVTSDELHDYAEKIFKSFETTYDYNEHIVPPDINKAHEHQKANNFAVSNNCTNKKEDALSDLKRCKCCQKHLERVDLDPYGCNMDIDHRMSELGSGYPLYFYLLKYAMIIFVILCVTSSFYMFQFYGGNFCVSQSQLMKRFKIINKEMNKEWGYNNNILKGLNTNLLKQKTTELPPLHNPYIGGLKQFEGSKLHDMMNNYCTWAEFLRNPKICHVYKKNNCHNKFSTYCKVLAYYHFLKSFYKRQCVVEWGINNTKFEMGNRPYLSQIYSEWYDYVNIFTVLSIWLTTQFFNVLFKIKTADYDNHDTTCADFTVILEGLPKRENIPHLHILDGVNELIIRHGYKSKESVMIYDTTHFKEIDDRLTLIKDKLGAYLYRIKLDPKFKDDIELKEIITKYNLNHTRLVELTLANYSGSCSREFTGLMCISFNTEPEKNEFLEEHRIRKSCGGCCKKQNRKLQLNFPDHEIVYNQIVKKAPEPSDILWDSYDHTPSARSCRKFIAYIVVTIALIIGALPIIVSNLWADNLLESKMAKATIGKNFDQFLKFKIVYILNSLLVVVVNQILEFIMTWAVTYSKQLTITNKETFLTAWLYKLQFLNSGLILVGVSEITFNYFGMNGISQTVNFVFILNQLLPITLIVFNPAHIISKLKKCFLHRAIDNKDPDLTTNQREANYLYEQQDFVMSIRLTFIFKNLSLAMFYLPISPLISFFGLFSILFEFFLFRFVLYKYSNNVHRYSSDITCRISNEFDTCLLQYPLGLCLAEAYLRGTSLIANEIKAVTFCQLIFCIVSTFVFSTQFTSGILYKKLFKKKHTPTPITYDEKMRFDSDDYLSSNPAMRKAAQKILAEKNLMTQVKIALNNATFSPSKKSNATFQPEHQN